MLTLVLDTASSVGTVGIVAAETVRAERRWQLTTTYSLELLAVIEAVLTESGVARTDLEGIVVGVGPGGYGSLRAGVATAQGLALGLEVPLAGVARLELDAVPHLGPARDAATPVVAVHDAGSSGTAWAVYAAGAWPAGPPLELQAPRLGSVAECLAASDPATAADARWCGELNDELRTALDAARPGWTEAAAAPNMPRALHLSQLAHAHHAFGDPAAVDVVYLRPAAITPPRDDPGGRAR